MSAPSSSADSKLSTGDIVGTVVAIVGFLWLVALALWWLLRKWRASRTTQTAARTGGPVWHLGTHRYEHADADADEAPGDRESTLSDALKPAPHHGYDQPAASFGDKEAMLFNESPAPASRPPTPDPDPPAEEEARSRSESPATLVERPSGAVGRPESIKNIELLALAETDYSVAVARARSSSVPPPLPTMPAYGVYGGLGAELRRTSTNPFRARLHAAEVARHKPGGLGDDEREWWGGERA
ncbi:hypothetical protein LXA43DRAFT_1103067 [Ganoderma leucocontextum]|nr:hypothetical protein LXA43DRAFT_1103067 [Ganoderma leucocontextum]